MNKLSKFSIFFLICLAVVYQIRFNDDKRINTLSFSTRRQLSAIKEKFCQGVLISQNSTASQDERDEAKSNRQSIQAIRKDNQIRKALKTQNFEEYGTGLIPYCAPWIAMLGICIISLMMYCMCSVCNM